MLVRGESFYNSYRPETRMRIIEVESSQSYVYGPSYPFRIQAGNLYDPLAETETEFDRQMSAIMKWCTERFGSPYTVDSRWSLQALTITFYEADAAFEFKMRWM